MNFLWSIVLLLASVICWGLNLVGLPGNWLVVLLAIVYAQFGPEEGRAAMPWGVVAALVVLALVGELVELLAGAVGTQRAGGSKRGAVLALVGSLLGGLIGLFVGVPIPLLGSLVAAVLFGGIGALVGAVIGERWKGRDFGESLRIGEAAFWSRLLGTLGKTVVGAVMLVLLLAAVLL